MAEETKIETKDMAEVKERKSIGKLITSVEGLRRTADFLEKMHGKGDVELEHFIAQLDNGKQTIAVDVKY